MESGKLQELVALKIENLRPKLLDLSRRNPLVSTRLGGKSTSYVRVVDELPDVLFYQINHEQKVQIVPLPDIDTDPKDENTKAFSDALSNARLTNETYLRALEAVNQEAENFLDLVRNIERALRDWVRSILGLPERQKSSDINLVQHAKNNGITPSFDLPKPDQKHEDGRHTDEKIQTLLLPKDLERRLNTITAKCRTWLQETGINVLQVAYGFLEWSEPGQTETSFAPLILAPAEIEKRRTRNGMEFWLKSSGDDPEINAVIAEKLKVDFNVILPTFDGTSVEAYFAAIQELAPNGMVWKVRRQVAIGVFPSARMAMYHDLSTSDPIVTQSSIVGVLLGGSNSEASAPFADEYLVDEPQFEKCVPFTVMDADSSQFSTLVDIANNKNLAVEGPPGTGKSQTIVNAIANALASGKKVLFVAEKLAALNVVRSRLESVGLGEYLLTLQAERSSREQVIDSVRARIEMKPPPVVNNYANKIAQFRAVRTELAHYIDVLRKPFRDSGFTVHELLGKCISVSKNLEEMPLDIQRQCNIPTTFLNADGLSKLRDLADRVQGAHARVLLSTNTWQSTGLLHPNKFTVDEACDLALKGAGAFRELAKLRSDLKQFNLDPSFQIETLKHFERSLAAVEQISSRASNEFLARCLDRNAAQTLRNFADQCRGCVQNIAGLREVLASEITPAAIDTVGRISSACKTHNIKTLDLNALRTSLDEWREGITIAQSLARKLQPLIQAQPDASSWSVAHLGEAQAIVSNAGRDVLAIRSSAIAEVTGLSKLKRLCREGKALRDLGAELSARLALNNNMPVDDLERALSILRSAGILSFLSPKYHRAKAVAAGVALSGKYKQKQTQPLLEELISYRKRVADYDSNASATGLFGTEFQGIETNFEIFERLAIYYDSIQAGFNTLETRPLRNFLRNGDADDLALIPVLTGGSDDLSYQSLAANIDGWITDYNRVVAGFGILAPLVGIFRAPSSIDTATLDELVERMREVDNVRTQLERSTEVAVLLGDQFKGLQTDLGLVCAACDCAEGAAPNSELLKKIVTSKVAKEARNLVHQVVQSSARANELLDALCECAKLRREEISAGRSHEEIAEFLSLAGSDREGLFVHAGFAAASADFQYTGAAPHLMHTVRSTGRIEALGDQIVAMAMRKLAHAVYEEHGARLTQCTGIRLDELRASLAKQDREIIALSRDQLRSSVYAAAKPPRGIGTGKKSTWTEMALLENETAKQQRFAAVRDLTSRAGRALLELKPCWMMSPLAVAQYVPKGEIEFDLCIIDEASQMPPEASIGAILRSKQIVVVGDTNQLPPSSFFKSMIDDEDSDEDETVLEESILAMANATFRPSRRLRWHYRSKHSGLIKFSNRLVYDDNLVVFPSPTEGAAGMGVEYRRVDGLYKSGTNPVEARVIVDAILNAMRHDPSRSLGVVTLNQKQRDLIREEFENAVASDGAAIKYLESWKERKDGLEEFFIKNLENVQGDERDVIFIGTVYGPEIAGGRVAQRFGPVNGLAGKRRLNVLFSRAKEKIVTFSSMTAADVLAEEDDNAGANMLKRWLEYSATGVLEGGVSTQREPDSDFEIFVADQIKSMGFIPVPQVGAAGYFIDIGVRHPNWPHGFLLGVECDGATYHSAKSARDRDRLRQEVLEGQGWRLHRIWSTDWFNHTPREVERLRAVIVARLEELKGKESEYIRQAPVVISEPLTEKEPQAARDDSGALAIRSSDLQNGKGGQLSSKAGISIGDTVRVRYLDKDKAIVQITILNAANDLENGIISAVSPMARALLGAEEGDEVEILVGSYVRLAVVECVVHSQNAVHL